MKKPAPKITRKPVKRDNIVYGFHPVAEALTHSRPLEKILVRQGNTHERIKEIRELARTRQIPVQTVPEEKITQLCPDGVHQGVIAIMAAVAYRSLEQTILEIQGRGEVPLLLMLDGITDVRNFGAIARTAECMGVQAMIVPGQGAAPISADAVKTSAGALMHLPVCREEHLTDAILMLQAYDIAVVACTEKARDIIYDTDLSGPLCIIVGAEDKGISPSLLKRAGRLVAIPMVGNIESLNVSVAAGMILSEAVRQRRA
ncbi:MAG: 23S rRNA (guanosine(2251)-2'-O)-methyltransferase RlmB [Bacteroidia bacterium]|nr:23S rRNA (guanosine(2251)-2'-O)-methyltransferase RlmB [Bacteroidia bacterium]